MNSASRSVATLNTTIGYHTSDVKITKIKLIALDVGNGKVTHLCFANYDIKLYIDVIQKYGY